jgi:hypothetical protein
MNPPKTNHSITRSMNHATRAARKEVAEPKDTPPLTKAQWEAQRRAEELEEREKIKKLRQDWAEHDQRVRAIKFSIPKTP